MSTETGAFDDEDVEFAELLLSHTESALDRLDRERELERQNDRLEEFAGIVSHDLRNPLNVATAHLELAADGDDEHHAAIDDALTRIEAILDDTLDLARHGRTVLVVPINGEFQVRGRDVQRVPEVVEIGRASCRERV